MKHAVMTALLAMAFAALSCSCSSGGESLLDFDHTLWDCGTLSGDASAVFHTFTAVNTSSGEVRIQNFVPSCNCVNVLAYPVTLTPGEMFEITVSFDPKGEKGSVQRSVELLDAGGKSLGRLDINANILQPQ